MVAGTIKPPATKADNKPRNIKVSIESDGTISSTATIKTNTPQDKPAPYRPPFAKLNPDVVSTPVSSEDSWTKVKPRNQHHKKPQPRKKKSEEKLVPIEKLKLADSESDSEEEEDFPYIQREVHVVCPFGGCSDKSQTFTDPTLLPPHLKSQHQIIIKNLYHMTSSLQPYLSFCATRVTGELPFQVINPDTDEVDKSARHDLQQATLKQVLQAQEDERNTLAKLPRTCLFCRVVSDNRTALFKHMFGEHGFNIGLPDNLVYVEEFLKLLETKLEQERCLYCDKVFKDPLVLRKHMRKKKHFKIHPKNHTYDRFYVINYAEPGLNWEALAKEDEETTTKNQLASSARPVNDLVEESIDPQQENGNQSWDEWDEQESQVTYSLLNPKKTFATPELSLKYDYEQFGLDLNQIRTRWNLDFYQRIKLINYVRHMTQNGLCIGCGQSCENDEERQIHYPNPQNNNNNLTNNKGCLFDWPPNPALDEATFWTDPRYLLPTIDNDPLLMYLDEAIDDDDEYEKVKESNKGQERDPATPAASVELPSSYQSKLDPTQKQIYAQLGVNLP